MSEKKYGEFDSFEAFFQDVLYDLSDSSLIDEHHDIRKDSSGTGFGHLNEEDKERKERDSTNNPEQIKDTDRIRSKKTGSTRIGIDNIDNIDASIKHRASDSLAFFLILGLITVLAWSLPLRPTVSVSEKRNLDAFPVFSVQTLASGEYFRSIENWFSDTFTFRESWIKMGDRIKSLFGIQTVAIYGEVPVADAIPVPIAVAVSSEDTPNLSEEQETTAITGKIDISSPEDLESLPEEENQWGGIVIDEDALIEDRGAKLLIGDHFFVYPEFNQEYAQRYAKKINNIATLLEGKANFYCLIAPHSISSMLTREDREKYGVVIEEDALEYIYSLMNSDVKKVNVLPNLQKHNNEYICFKSDPHWTALGAYYAYETWCEVAGKEPVPLSQYREYVWEDFFGTYYYTGGMPKSIRDNPDIVYAYEPPGDVHLYLDYMNRDKLGTEQSLLVDMSEKKVDQYITFLGTDEAKATFINNDIEDDSAVLVLKTSFGNPFVYYLTQHYHMVYVIDVRYYRYYSVTKFVEKCGVSDVILIHATDLCYSEGGVQTATLLLK